MKERRCLQIEKTTRDKLRNLRITSRETYDEVLNRLILIAKEVKNINS